LSSIFYNPLDAEDAKDAKDAKSRAVSHNLEQVSA
jgi:hypothetical protein